MKLCPFCFKEYKKSKIGKQQRKLKLQKLPNQYSKGNWPEHLYHNESGKLCKSHQLEYTSLIRKEYQERDLYCKSLGFTSYKAYLESDLWSEIRTKILTESNFLCFICSDKAEAVHHSSYNLNVLSGKDYTKLHPICKKCHNKLEFFDNGFKVKPSDTMKRINK